MPEQLRYSVRMRGGLASVTIYSGSGGISSSSRAFSSGGDSFAAEYMHIVRDAGATRSVVSVYAAVPAVNGRPAGAVTKMNWSELQQNGPSFAEAVFSGDRAVGVWYAPNHAETRAVINLNARNSLAEDAMPLWAQRRAYPFLARGGTFRVWILARLATGKFTAQDGTLRLEVAPEVVRVPAGSFTANVLRAAAGGQWWHFWVERPEPNRILKWQTSAGEIAELLG